MAIMFPSTDPDDSVPPSEVAVINSIRSSVGAGDWRVYHSVYLENPLNPARPPEIDFIICIPQRYAIVCLEAKNGIYVTIDAGNAWKNKRDGTELRPTPPEKARKVMYGFGNELKRKGILRQYGASFISFECAVAIPEGKFEGEELPREALLLQQASIDNPEQFARDIDEYCRKATRKKPKTEDERIAARKVFNDIIDYLERVAEMRPADITRHYLNTVRGLLRPTSEQSHCLKLTDDNPRCIVDGAAGTGKTVLAKELARRLCEDDGQSVGLLCSNAVFVSNDLEPWASTVNTINGGLVTVGTPASLLMNVLGESNVARQRLEKKIAESPEVEGTLKNGDIHQDWEPFIRDVLGDLPEDGIFDYLVVDEAQNLCAPPFLALFDRLLKGRLFSGRWTMFGDFVNQNIVSPRINDGISGKDLLEEHYENIRPAYTKLQTNCRNTQDVATETYKLVGIDAPTMLGVRGPEVEFEYFTTQRGLDDILGRRIRGLRDKYVDSSQIVLLTNSGDGEFRSSRTYGGWRLLSLGESREIKEREILRSSDIYDFQGLESDVVILLLLVSNAQSRIGGRVMLPSENQMRRLFYVGMSRARSALIVIADRSYRGTIDLRRELHAEMAALL